MYCKYCGKEISDEKDICENCKNERNETNAIQEIEPVKNEGTSQQTSTQTASAPVKGKSKIAAGLFGIFLGIFGVHNFYLGYTGKAIAQLLITLLTFGLLSFVSAIWGLIEGILILTGDIDKDANGNLLRE